MYQILEIVVDNENISACQLVGDAVSNILLIL